MKNFIFLFSALFFLVLISNCSSCDKQPASFQGPTMGTTYHVKLGTSFDLGKEELKILENKIEKQLKNINQEMSTYIKSSEISKFNKAGSGVTYQLPENFDRVLDRALQINKLTKGAFDITIDPLINLWGFDKDGRIKERPKDFQIKAAMSQTGHNKLVYDDGWLSKKYHSLKINLSSIAKGFAVDALAELLESENIFEYMIEIGGEIRTSINLKESGNKSAWTIGIENPLAPMQKNKILGTVELKNAALASSGTYLNKFEDKNNKKNYSHIIDPRTGEPVETNLISVSILSKSSMTADALATAALVMGEAEFRKLLRKMPGIEALFVYIEENKTRISQTRGFELK